MTLFPFIMIIGFMLWNIGLPTKKEIRDRWDLPMYILMLLGTCFEIVALWPRAELIGAPVDIARSNAQQMHQNLTLCVIAAVFTCLSFAVFLLKCRRSAG